MNKLILGLIFTAGLLSGCSKMTTTETPVGVVVEKRTQIIHRLNTATQVFEPKTEYLVVLDDGKTLRLPKTIYDSGKLGDTLKLKTVCRKRN